MSSILSSLSDEQRAAAESRAKYVRVIAGPGSGKTSTLAGRVTSLLLDQMVSPRVLVCVSFTRKASAELRDRIESSLATAKDPRKAESACRQITFGTMHSFCLSILRAFSNVVGLPENLIVLDEADATDIQKELSKRFKVKGDQLKEVYAKHKISIGAADYDDLLRHTLTILADPRALAWVQSQHRYFVYDEMQDIGPDEYAILRTINPRGLTVVGDPDQNIYSWRGTNLRFLMMFDQDWPGCETFYLSANFRSTEAVVRAANNLISYNNERLEKPSVSLRSGGGVRAAGSSAGYSDGNLVALFPGNAVWSEWAILARSNRAAQAAGDELRYANIPHRILSDSKSFWGQQPVRLTLAALRFCENQKYDWALTYLLRSGLYGEVTEVDIAQARLEQVQIRGSLWQSWRSREGLNSAEILRDVSDLYEATLSTLPVVIAAGTVMDLLGLRRFYDDIGLTGKAEMLQELLTRMAEWGATCDGDPTTRNFLAWSAMRAMQDNHKADENTVTISTIHGGKGLEWEHVIIADAVQGHLPLTREGCDLEEERRLMYVAMTRARQTVDIVCFDPKAGKQPSQFVNEIRAPRIAVECVVTELDLHVED